MENKSVDLKHEREGWGGGGLGRPVGLEQPEMESDSSEIKEGSEGCRCDS